jgi:hypothetical protein
MRRFGMRSRWHRRGRAWCRHRSRIHRAVYGSGKVAAGQGRSSNYDWCNSGTETTSRRVRVSSRDLHHTVRGWRIRFRSTEHLPHDLDYNWPKKLHCKEQRVSISRRLLGDRRNDACV